jgi:TetR/AcrR family transcriptional regulator, transcriptional repressor for nem operon
MMPIDRQAYGVSMDREPVDTRQHLINAAERIMGHKGFAAVGINEVLSSAGVPKGSFYHWFSSKDDFGRAVIDSYFRHYLAATDSIAGQPHSGAERLMRYWQSFYDMQVFDDCSGKCLVVKLGAEVSDFSESMRAALIRGTEEIIGRIAAMISDGREDGSILIEDDAHTVAKELYGAWIGASVLAKIHRDPRTLNDAMVMTSRRLKGLP